MKKQENDKNLSTNQDEGELDFMGYALLYPTSDTIYKKYKKISDSNIEDSANQGEPNDEVGDETGFNENSPNVD